MTTEPAGAARRGLRDRDEPAAAGPDAGPAGRGGRAKSIGLGDALAAYVVEHGTPPDEVQRVTQADALGAPSPSGRAGVGTGCRRFVSVSQAATGGPCRFGRHRPPTLRAIRPGGGAPRAW